MFDHTTLSTPTKLCECGCGQPAPIAKYSFPARGWIKGQPKRFINGHNTVKHKRTLPPNPGGLCMCGCGQPTPIAKQTHTARGLVAGQPIRYINEHYSRVQPTVSAKDRFWANVSRRNSEQCWEWMGHRDALGYGSLKVNGKECRAHRFSYELHKSSIPDGLLVLHKCDNPSCVNPEHLFLGTDADNAHDRDRKGRLRHPKGETHPSAKLTETDVIEIRARYSDGETISTIARRYNVARFTIRSIATRRTWTHI